MDILVVNGITITVAEILVNPWLTPMMLGAHCAPCTQATFKSPTLLGLRFLLIRKVYHLSAIRFQGLHLKLRNLWALEQGSVIIRLWNTINKFCPSYFRAGIRGSEEEENCEGDNGDGVNKDTIRLNSRKSLKRTKGFKIQINKENLYQGLEPIIL